ncbi:alpha/beta hydrolase [Sphingomonas sp.]|jgi:pimeloyl-ACP methyl ester carboxylesterase|uniref:alpha/beta fold hydrolase n=1 Tax=Sphingomonas sp. TaxID=28214 RepID=UPI002D7E67CC|nr:alpha/beta hydrolase [Sphingomonas sp.]HEU0045769.1 alpha/beta hydrolase [Sphingomonas sp.]
MAGYEDRFVLAVDGVRLHLRDYPGDPGRPPVVCLPGLTRNARDYAMLAECLAGAWRVLAIDLRGRGESGRADDWASYTPATYAEDVRGVMHELGIGRFVAVGTSLGGIVAMMIAAAEPGRLAGAVLNDIGPTIEAAGLQRIRGYVGRGSSHPTWLHAARAVQEGNRDVYPDWTLDEWLQMAKRLYRLTDHGKIVLDYDLRIAEPFRQPGGEAPADLWPALDALRDTPVLIVRGERSDVLSAATAAQMVAGLQAAELVTVPRVGHAPTLNEAEAVAGIARLLARLA